MNVCHFIGNVCADPEVRSTGSGKQVASFSLAVNRPGKSDETAFLRCEAWEKTAEFIEKYFHKGDPIIIHASVRQDEWDDKETGKKRTALKFVVDRAEFVPGGKRKTADEGAASDAQAPTPTKEKAAKSKSQPVSASGKNEDDDIPF